MTPVKLLELFFNDVLVEMIVGYTKLYSHREKAGISFQMTNKKKFLLLMFMLIGCHKPSIAITTEFCPLHRQLCLLQTSCLIDCEQQKGIEKRKHFPRKSSRIIFSLKINKMEIYLKQGLIQCLVIPSRLFFGISIVVTTNNLINEANSRRSFR